MKRVSTGQHQKSGAWALYDVYQHSSASALQDVIKGAERMKKGSVSASPVGNDQDYVSSVTIGKQTFALEFDTTHTDT